MVRLWQFTIRVNSKRSDGNAEEKGERGVEGGAQRRDGHVQGRERKHQRQLLLLIALRGRGWLESGGTARRCARRVFQHGAQRSARGQRYAANDRGNERRVHG